MLNFNLFFPFLPGPKRTFVLYVLEEQSQFDLSMCVLRALFTVCTLPDLICRGLSSITFIYKKGLFMQIHATMLQYISSYRTYRQISHNWPLQNFQSHLKILSTFFFTLVIRLVSSDSDLLFKIKFLFSLHWKLSQINLKYIK